MARKNRKTLGKVGTLGWPTGCSCRPSQRSNTKGYSPELCRSPVFFDFPCRFLF